jgi:phage-related protein
MTIATFTPTPKPSPGTQRKPKLKLLKAEFGDGYTQTTPDGLNFVRRTLQLKWDLLTPTQADTFDTFFTTNAAEPFWYTPSDETVAVKWTCTDWSSTVIEGGYRSFTAAFEQDFNLLT